MTVPRKPEILIDTLEICQRPINETRLVALNDTANDVSKIRAYILAKQIQDIICCLKRFSFPVSFLSLVASQNIFISALIANTDYNKLVTANKFFDPARVFLRIDLLVNIRNILRKSIARQFGAMTFNAGISTCSMLIHILRGCSSQQPYNVQLQALDLPFYIFAHVIVIITVSSLCAVHFQRGDWQSIDRCSRTASKGVKFYIMSRLTC